MNILFICNQNMHRSRTAAEMFSDRFETKSAGLYCEKPLAEKELSWADTVVVMEDAHRAEIASRFPKLYMQKRMVCLEVPDVYGYNQPELKEIIGKKMLELF